MSPGQRVSGSKIRQLREQRNLLQHDLASRLRGRGYGTTQTTVSRWESGQEPRSHVLPALAQELGVAVTELYGDEETTASEDDEESDLLADLTSALRALVHSVVAERVA